MEKIVKKIKGSFYLLGSKEATETMLGMIPALRPQLEPVLSEKWEKEIEIDSPEDFSEACTMLKKTESEMLAKFEKSVMDKAVTNQFDLARNAENLRRKDDPANQGRLQKVVSSLGLASAPAPASNEEDIQDDSE